MQVSEWINTEMFKVIGWSIIHSIWQSLILFAALKVFLLIIKKNNSNLRYFTGISILLGVIICSIYTFQHEYKFFIHNNIQPLITTTNSLKGNLQVPPDDTNLTSDSKVGTGLNFLNFLNNISPYLAVVWIIGMLFYSTKILNSSFYLKRLSRLPTEFYPEANKKIGVLCDKMGINKIIRLIITNKVSQPLTFGYFKPIIILPFSYVTQVPMEQLEMILAHELSHIKRHDFLVNLLQASLEAIYFFNPFFQSISDIVRNEREYCCDDMASTFCGNDKTMAIALTNLKILTMHPKLSLSAAPVKNIFHERVYRLIYPTSKSKLSIANSFLTFVIITFTILLLTKCVYDHKEIPNLKNTNLPERSDYLKQLLADNQANHKIDVLAYENANQKHEIFLVSTIKGKPLYAYLDGTALSDNQLNQVFDVIKSKRTISMSDVTSIPQTPEQIRMNRIVQLNNEVDFLDKAIKRTEAEQSSNHSYDLKNKLNFLKERYAIKAGEIKALSMENYSDEVRNIPVEVQLHELLTKIIVNREYTVEERKKLNELINQKQ